jgi:hypothetical protein
MSDRPTTTIDRYQTIVSMLREILARLDAIEKDVDDIDRTMRPHGDGTKIRDRWRRGR